MAAAGSGPGGGGSSGSSSRRTGASNTYDRLQYGDLVAFYVEDKVRSVCVARVGLIDWID